jgi:alpha-galactosidase
MGHPAYGLALCPRGNVINHGSITNLPDQSCVEVPCLVDHNGIQPAIVGELPPQCAALIQTNLNVQELVTRTLSQLGVSVYSLQD